VNETRYEEIRGLMTRSAAPLLWLALALCARTALVPPTISPRGGLVRSPALVVLTNVNPTGAVFYTLDGGDPSGHFGNVVTNARSYSEPVSVNYSLVIRAREVGHQLES